MKSSNIRHQIVNALERIDLCNLAEESKFVRRKPRKITAPIFIKMLLVWACEGYQSWRLAALGLSISTQTLISKTALFKRCKNNAVDFVKKVIEALIASTDAVENLAFDVPIALQSFRRIIVQDSTCIKLHSRLAEFFPGAKNHTQSTQASLKIQAAFDVLSQQFIYFQLACFRDNDQSAAKDIEFVKKGDLIIRDLGYFVLNAFQAIIDQGAFFVSRWQHNTALLDPQTKAPIQLLKILKKSPGKLDMSVLLGCKKQIPVRLVAIKLPQDIAQQRRRKAKNDRHPKANPSKEKLQLLGWELFITNIDFDVCETDVIAQIYGVRWQIEILFKSWKSYLNLKHAPSHNRNTVELWVYAKLLLATLIHIAVVKTQYQLITASASRIAMSPLKTISVVREIIIAEFKGSIEKIHDGFYIKLVVYFSRYERSKHRQHFFQCLTSIGNTKN